MKICSKAHCKCQMSLMSNKDIGLTLGFPDSKSSALFHYAM